LAWSAWIDRGPTSDLDARINLIIIIDTIAERGDYGMRSTTSRALGLLAVTVFASTAAACGGDDSASSSADAPASITVARPEASQLSPTYTGWRVAEGQGLLDEVAERFGTNVEFINTGNDTDALTALLSGRADIAGIGVNNVMAAASQGRDLVVTPSLSVGTPIVLVGPKRYETERGTDLSLYDGARLGIYVEGTTPTADALMQDAGIDYESVPLGSTSAMLPALEAGRIDLTVMDFGSAARTVAAGDGYIVAEPDEFPDQVRDFLGGGLVYSPEFVERYPELVDAITAALINGLTSAQAAERPAEALALFTPEFQETYSDPATWELLWALVEQVIEGSDGGFSQDQLEATIEIAVAGDRITQAQADALEPNLREIFDDNRTNRAYEQLGISRPTENERS
jgi:NitT/TauT family transport system substrate-binding protein